MIIQRYRLLGPSGTYESETPGLLGGNGLARIYGRLDCSAALRARRMGDRYTKHQVFFASEEVARACGYRPCGTCMREAYRAWKAGSQGA